MHADKPAAARKDSHLILRLTPAPAQAAKMDLIRSVSPIALCQRSASAPLTYRQNF